MLNNTKSLTIGKKTSVMGILNVTPDSFGWRPLEYPGWYRVHALEMVWTGRISSISEPSPPGRDLFRYPRRRNERLLPFLGKAAARAAGPGIGGHLQGADSRRSPGTGILPALESSHALGLGADHPHEFKKGDQVVVNLSGRGDKDLGIVNKALGFAAQGQEEV